MSGSKMQIDLAATAKKLAPWLLTITGVLGVLKTVVEYISSAIEHHNIIVGLFYCIGASTIAFLAFFICFSILSCWIFLILYHALPLQHGEMRLQLVSQGFVLVRVGKKDGDHAHFRGAQGGVCIDS